MAQRILSVSLIVEGPHRSRHVQLKRIPVTRARAGGMPDMAQRIMSVSPNVGGTMVSMSNQATKSFVAKAPRGRSFIGTSMTKPRNSGNSIVRPQKSAGRQRQGGEV
eukprot:1160142-Pelagomonas_calceolata.AAC.26